MKYYAVIVGGGSGTRMQSSLPKQFLLLHGKPVIMHSIERFYTCKNRPQIRVVLNSAQHQYWKELCKKFNFDIPHVLVNGGNNRFESVQNALPNLEDGYVAIHDAVRPLADVSDIENAYNVALHSGNAVLGVFATDTIRRINGEGSEVLDRSKIFLVQTPQIFSTEILKKAYEQSYRSDFTDDASVVEKLGIEIKLVEGKSGNIKITYPEDLSIAEAILKNIKAG